MLLQGNSFGVFIIWWSVWFHRFKPGCVCFWAIVTHAAFIIGQSLTFRILRLFLLCRQSLRFTPTSLFSADSLRWWSRRSIWAFLVSQHCGRNGFLYYDWLYQWLRTTYLLLRLRWPWVKAKCTHFPWSSILLRCLLTISNWERSACYVVVTRTYLTSGWHSTMRTSISLGRTWLLLLFLCFTCCWCWTDWQTIPVHWLLKQYRLVHLINCWLLSFRELSYYFGFACCHFALLQGFLCFFCLFTWVCWWNNGLDERALSRLPRTHCWSKVFGWLRCVFLLGRQLLLLLLRSGKDWSNLLLMGLLWGSLMDNV